MSALSSAAKIGVFDSGLGGLSVLREIHQLLPDCSTIYVADQAHLPYGPRPAAEIDSYADAITRFLLDSGAQVIVIACHSASAASLQLLRQRYPDVPFVGIEPAVKPAAEATQTGIIGVLTTQATADGPLYRRVLEQFATDVQVLTRVSPDLVALVEAGEQDNPAGHEIIRRAITPLLDARADHIVLACTHFPFLVAAIGEIAGPSVHLIDPGPAVARQTARLWQADCEAPPTRDYLTSGATSTLEIMLRRLIGIEATVTQAQWHEGENRLRLSTANSRLP